MEQDGLHVLMYKVRAKELHVLYNSSCQKPGSKYEPIILD